ncbi:MAG: hypothetical protein AAFZ49_00110 [Cyanobacteria bacterium J06659_2]
MNISLGEFERRHGVNKGTVSKRARELGFNTSSGLNPEAYQALKTEFRVSAPAPESHVIPTQVMPRDFIQAGNLAPVEKREIQLPTGFNPTAMVQLFDGVTGQATDTAALVKIADMAITSVETAMDQKLDSQRQQLSQSEQDAKQLEGKISEAKTRLQVKALESKMLAERQTSATQSTEELFAALMEMGKPAAASGSE